MTFIDGPIYFKNYTKTQRILINLLNYFAIILISIALSLATNFLLNGLDVESDLIPIAPGLFASFFLMIGLDAYFEWSIFNDIEKAVQKGQYFYIDNDLEKTSPFINQFSQDYVIKYTGYIKPLNPKYNGVFQFTFFYSLNDDDRITRENSEYPKIHFFFHRNMTDNEYQEIYEQNILYDPIDHNLKMVVASLPTSNYKVKKLSNLIAPSIIREIEYKRFL